MIIVGIKNGLGNQMFQFAFGKVLEWRYKTNIYFDIMNDDFVSDMNTDMDVFNIGEYNEIDKKYVKSFLPFSVAKYRIEKKYIQYIYFKIRRYIHPKKLVLEKLPSEYNYYFENLNLQRDYYFMGHWMNFKYFSGYEDKIRNMFTLKEASYLHSSIVRQIKEERYQSVSVHIRRGDYLTSGFIEALDLKYYSRAIEIIKNKLQNPYIYIFTNDVQWVKANFEFDIPFEIITDNIGADSYKDIVLMSLCQHNIIANSSFSWWGAWLNLNSHKIVIAPKKWYPEERLNININQMIPDNWIMI